MEVNAFFTFEDKFALIFRKDYFRKLLCVFRLIPDVLMIYRGPTPPQIFQNENLKNLSERGGCV